MIEVDVCCLPGICVPLPGSLRYLTVYFPCGGCTGPGTLTAPRSQTGWGARGESDLGHLNVRVPAGDNVMVGHPLKSGGGAVVRHRSSQQGS